MVGVSLGWGKRLRWPDDYFTLSVQLAYQRYMMRNWSYMLMTNGNANNLNLTIALNRTSTDNQLFPRRGSEFEASVNLTPPWSAFDNKDYKNLANNSKSPTYSEEQQEKYRWIEYHKWKFKAKTYTALTSGQKCFVLMTRVDLGGGRILKISSGEAFGREKKKKRSASFTKLRHNSWMRF